jgi:very-short-patch-repair endonuclease
VRRHILPADVPRDQPFTVAQARAVGLTRTQLEGASYRQLLHSVYVCADVPDSELLRAQAASLVLPDDAVVGLASAAWLLGADVLDARRPGLFVIANRGDQIRRAGVNATSALLSPGDVTEVHGVPVTTPVRTAFDLARRKDLVEAVVGVDAMLNRGGCRLDDLAAYTADHRKWRYVRTVDEALRQAEPLSESPMETRQRMRLIFAGLPRPEAQVPVRDSSGFAFAYIDNGYEEWMVGADYDGGDHEKTWKKDLERQERVRDEGWWHRRYTSLHINRGATQMCRQVRNALQRAGWRPPAMRSPLSPIMRKYVV